MNEDERETSAPVEREATSGGGTGGQPAEGEATTAEALAAPRSAGPSSSPSAPEATDATGPEARAPGTSEPAATEPGDPTEPGDAPGDVAEESTGTSAEQRVRRRRVDPARVAGYLGAGIVGAILAGILFVALGSGGGTGASPSPAATSSSSPEATEAIATATPSAPAVDGGIPVDGMAIGRPDAPVTIEIWSDFQCPYCSLLAHAIEPDLLRGPVAQGQVRLVYSDYVFLGQESLGAAVAARCAARQGMFWRYHDLLFATQRGENQGTFSAQFLVNLAGFAGLDPKPFQACVAEASVASAVVAETSKGAGAGVESTPTLVIRGPVATRTIRGFPSWSDLLLEIERATGKAPIPLPSPSAAPTASGATPATSGSPGESAAPSRPGGTEAPGGTTPASSTTP
jgi:protein-disulfide isomerase